MKKISMTSKRVKMNLYDIDYILPNGHCYRTTSNATWSGVREAKKLAKMLGETIRYEKTCTIYF